MKYLLGVLVISAFSTLAQAETIFLPLNSQDQSRLTRELSKIDISHRTREVIQETPYLIIKNTYNFLTTQDAFFIQCSEEFMNASTVGTNQQCVVGFNYEASVGGQIEAHDGFMPEFSIAQINEPTTAKVLYQSVGNGVSPSVFFNSTEQIVFTHPTTGQKFPAFRLRIDCKRDDQYKSFQCVVSGVK